MDKSFIKKLMTSIKCGACGQQYDGDNINVLAHEDYVWFLRASCPACHTKCLIVALIKEGETPEVITDLTEAELDKLRDVGAPTPDDMLDMHNFLKAFDGDFSQLFTQK